MANEEIVIFREVQRFGLWIWAVIIVETVGAITAIVIARLERNTTLAVLVTLVILTLSFVVLFLILRLETEVRSDGLYVRLYPFHISYKKFVRQDIEEYHACEYRPIRDYGGWGIRYGLKGKAYNVSGKKGVQLVFKNGKRLLVGSQRTGELVKAIDSIG